MILFAVLSLCMAVLSILAIALCGRGRPTHHVLSALLLLALFSLAALIAQ
ncbi:hypothetical protein ACFQ6V_09020 [Streptomyces roseifaciens]